MKYAGWLAMAMMAAVLLMLIAKSLAAEIDQVLLRFMRLNRAFSLRGYWGLPTLWTHVLRLPWLLRARRFFVDIRPSMQ